MTRHDLEVEALRLDPREKLRLAHTLVSSLGEMTSEDIEALWVDEAERRDEEVESGQVQAIGGPEVFERLRKRRY